MIRQVAPEGFHDVRRIVGGREDPAAPLDLGLNAVTPEDVDQLLPKPAVEGAREGTGRSARTWR